jgi:cellulose biosynthesis protein BcsQ
MKKIVFYNKKGGVGKTSIAFNIAKDLDYYLLSNDDSTIEKIYPEKSRILEKIDTIEANSIYDLGGFIDHNNIKLFKESDLIVIPLMLDINSLKRTLNTVLELEEYNKNIILIINRVTEYTKKKYKQFYDKLELLELPIFELRESQTIANSTLSGETIIEQFNKNNLSKKNLVGIFEDYAKILKYIKEI